MRKIILLKLNVATPYSPVTPSSFNFLSESLSGGLVALNAKDILMSSPKRSVVRQLTWSHRLEQIKVQYPPKCSASRLHQLPRRPLEALLRDPL